MKKPLTIALDIDNVSADTNSHLMPFINEKYGCDLCINDIKEWSPKWKYDGHVIDFTKELFANFDNPDFMDNIPMMEGAKEGIVALAGDGYDLMFLTGRSPKYEEYTRNWMKNNGLDDIDLVMAPEGKQQHVKKFDMLIDDSPKEITSVSLAGRDCIVFDRPWNKEVKQLMAKRVATWDEFVREVRKLT